MNNFIKINLIIKYIKIIITIVIIIKFNVYSKISNNITIELNNIF